MLRRNVAERCQIKRIEVQTGDRRESCASRILRCINQLDWRKEKNVLQNLTRRLSKMISRMEEKEQQMMRIIKRNMKCCVLAVEIP